LFEFERQACVDIYSVLVAAGLELSQQGHIRFTNSANAPAATSRLRNGDCQHRPEIQTFPVEMVHGSLGPEAA